MVALSANRAPDVAVADAATPQDRRRQRHSSHIERVALELMAEHGFDGVTVDEIADAADISRRTFFRYFPSKEDVLLGERARRLEQVLAEFRDRPADEPAAVSLRHTLVTLAERFEADRDIILLRSQIMRRDGDSIDHSSSPRSERLGPLTEAVAERLTEPTTHRAMVLVAAMLTTFSVVRSNWLATGARGRLVGEVTSALDELARDLGSLPEGA